MTSEQVSPLQAVRCPPSLRREALLQLAAAHDPERQAALSEAVKTMYQLPDALWEGLWICLEAGRMTGAIWVQPLPMNMAQLWLPKADGIHARLLLRAAYAWVKSQPIRLCHLELSPQTAVPEALLLEHGMQRLANLAYLTGSSHRRLAMDKAIPLSLQPFGAFSQPEQLALLAAVGHDSLDSCALREVLSVQELLVGFYQQDPQAPQHWYAVGYQADIVGVLLLAPRPSLGRWELMLMGLTPEWRGMGLGRALLNSALALAQQAGVQEVMLAVDDVNLPAKRLYQQAGFEQYAQQRLLAWKGDGERSDALINA
jgi:mycothiol synthase